MFSMFSVKGYSVISFSDEDEEEEDDEDYDEEGVDAPDGSGRKKKRKKKRKRMAGRKSKGHLSDKPQDFQVREKRYIVVILHCLIGIFKGWMVFKVMLSWSETTF